LQDFDSPNVTKEWQAAILAINLFDFNLLNIHISLEYYKKGKHPSLLV